MKTLALCLLLIGFPGARLAEESTSLGGWKYPGVWPSTQVSNSLGSAGKIGSTTLKTDDAVEKVFQWYANRAGLDSSDSLVKAADAGFASLATPLEQTKVYTRGTGAASTATLLIADVSAKHAHIVLYLREQSEASKTTTVSISQTPTGTNVVVIHRKDELERSDNTAK